MAPEALLQGPQVHECGARETEPVPPPAAMAEHVKLEGHNQEYYAAVRQSETGLYAVTWRECQDRWWSEKKGVCGTVLAVRGLSVRQRRTGLLACDCVRTGVAEL